MDYRPRLLPRNWLARPPAADDSDARPPRGPAAMELPPAAVAARLARRPAVRGRGREG